MRTESGSLRMLPVETLADLDAIPIYDNGEPLVDLRHACPGVLIGEPPLYARQASPRA